MTITSHSVVTRETYGKADFDPYIDFQSGLERS